MTLLLPIFFIVIDIISQSNNNRISIRKILKKNLPFLALSLLMVSVMYARGGEKGALVSTTHQYHMDFTVKTCFSIFNHYYSLLTWIPENKYPAGIFVILLVLGLWKRHTILLWSLLGYFLMQVPVLFYINRIPDIFLYIPHVFFSLSCGCLIDICFRKINSNIYKSIILASILFVLALTFNSKKIEDLMSYEVIHRKSINLLISFLTKSTTHIENDTKIYIANVPSFYMRQGKSKHLTYIFNQLCNDNSLSVFTDRNYEILKRWKTASSRLLPAMAITSSVAMTLTIIYHPIIDARKRSAKCVSRT